MPEALPIRIGVLHDFPQGDDLFVRTLRFGLATGAGERVDREFEIVERHARGLPGGSEAAVVRAFGELASEDVVAIAGPSISDNALIVAPLCDDARIPDRKSTRLNSSHSQQSRMPSSA